MQEKPRDEKGRFMMQQEPPEKETPKPSKKGAKIIKTLKDIGLIAIEVLKWVLLIKNNKK